MNGRIYDPGIGRFLSADPFVQFPHSTQGYNRYSYVGNNPLNATDPSGYFRKILGAMAGFVYGGLAGAVWGHEHPQEMGKIMGQVGPIASLGCMGWYAACTAANTAVSGYLQGASAQRSLEMGAKAGAMAYIGQQIAAGIGGSDLGRFSAATMHGLTQGTLSAAGGGRFGDGFLGGFAGHLSGGIPMFENAVASTIQAAIIGGTVAKIGGGKFANGAATAAMVHVFNNLAHEGARPAEEDDEYKLALVAERSNSESDTGHVFVGGIKPDGSTEAYGFYPKDHNVDALYVGEELEGIVLPDNKKFSRALSGSSDFKMKVFTVDRATYDSAMSYIQEYGQVGDYGLLTNSCVHAAFNTFNHVGLINSYSTNVPAVHPNTIYDAIKRGQ